MSKNEALKDAREDANYYGVSYTVWQDEDGEWHSRKSRDGEKKGKGRAIVKPSKRNPAGMKLPKLGKWISAAKVRLVKKNGVKVLEIRRIVKKRTARTNSGGNRLDYQELYERERARRPIRKLIESQRKAARAARARRKAKR